AVSAEPLLRQAVGPWAEWIKSDLPDFHAWERLLIVPRRAGQAKEQQAARAKWDAEHARRVAAAKKEGKVPPVEFPPMAPYAPWAERIDADWQSMTADFKAVPGLSAEQQQAADAALAHRRQQLADYLATEENAFADWQHELWRLGDWEAADEAGDLPFQSERIVEKRAETKGSTAGWVAQVRALEESLQRDLREVLSPEQSANEATRAAAEEALTDEKSAKLARINFAVTCLIIGVGACLLLGLFTRVAALGGIIFLLMVIATQPPWVPGAITTMFHYQLVEIAALVVLLVVGAGRWAGLDFFLRALFSRRRVVTERR
ncbi:MAG TPA: DoxX family protein, partial [Lacipirellulaceae bacterium]|nr:DoxX family protein [Lacipirellulaceae bacterium]